MDCKSQKDREQQKRKRRKKKGSGYYPNFRESSLFLFITISNVFLNFISIKTKWTWKCQCFELMFIMLNENVQNEWTQKMYVEWNLELIPDKLVNWSNLIESVSNYIFKRIPYSRHCVFAEWNLKLTKALILFWNYKKIQY